MPRLLLVLCALASAAAIAGCGAGSVPAGALSPPRTGDTAPAAPDPVAHSVSAVVSALARERARAAESAPAAPVIAPRPVAVWQPPPAPPPPPSSTAAAPTTGPNPIIALGDSLTFGWGRGASSAPYGPAPAHSYPWYVEQDLGVPVINAGISGTTAREVLDPASEPHHPRPASLQLPALLARHPRLVILSFGSNEVQRGWPVSQTAADLDRLLARVTGTGVPVLVVGTHVDCEADPCQGPSPGYTRQRYLSNWDAALSQLASRYQAGLVLDVERGFGRDDLTDWIHPTALGYWRMAQRIEPEVVAVLQRQGQRGPGAHPAPRLPAGGEWGPPSRPAPDPAPPPEPRGQSEMWPGGPHEFLPWNLERLLAILDHLGDTPPRATPPPPPDAVPIT
ncbi:MAG TPA: GDSL-type esterase/lipase family protein [Candidatus Dormibacteraeota bacterium]|jgi:acyl-CoA thioesterase-1